MTTLLPLAGDHYGVAYLERQLQVQRAQTARLEMLRAQVAECLSDAEAEQQMEQQQMERQQQQVRMCTTATATLPYTSLPSPPTHRFLRFLCITVPSRGARCISRMVSGIRAHVRAQWVSTGGQNGPFQFSPVSVHSFTNSESSEQCNLAKVTEK